MEAATEALQASVLSRPVTDSGPIPLAPSPLRHRVTHGLGAALIVGGVIGGWAAALSSLDPRGAALWAMAAAGVAAVAVAAAFARSMWRSVTEGRVDVRSEGLTIRHPAFFSGSLTVPYSRISKIAIDDGGLWGASADRCRFAVYDARDDGSTSHLPRRTLWGGADAARRPGSPLAALDVFPGVPPNVCLLLSEPVPVPRLRRVVSHGPMRDEHLAGLLVRVAEPSAFARRMPASLLGHITSRDFDRIKVDMGITPATFRDHAPRPHSEHRRAVLLARRYRREAIAAVVATVVLGIPLILRVAELSG